MLLRRSCCSELRWSCCCDGALLLRVSCCQGIKIHGISPLCHVSIRSTYLYIHIILLRTGDESRERGKHQGQARTQASDENLRDREKGQRKPKTDRSHTQESGCCGRDFKPRSAEP